MTAIELWDEANRYVSLGIRHFINEAYSALDSELEQELEAVADHMRINFLFPALSEKDRTTIYSAAFLSRVATISVNAHHLDEKSKTEAEKNYLAGRKMVEETIFDKLTDVQKQILREHFLTVEFGERISI